MSVCNEVFRLVYQRACQDSNEYIRARTEKHDRTKLFEQKVPRSRLPPTTMAQKNLAAHTTSQPVEIVISIYQIHSRISAIYAAP